MKNLTYLLFFFCITCFSQNKILCKTGKVTFEASVPTFEEVKANLNNAGAAINTNTGDFACVIGVKSFKFKNGLMQEHFNENYIESDKFPKAIFSGKIESFDFNSLSEKPVKMNLVGSIEIHGKKKNISIPLFIKKIGNNTNITSTFELKSEDFEIKIPSIVGYKIAKRVNVTTNFDFN